MSDDDADMDGRDDGEDHECQRIRIPLGHPPVIFALPGGRDLAAKVLAHLGWQLGVCTFRTFENGEIAAKIEQSVTNHDVYVICARDDLEAEVNFSIMRLLFLIDALRGESPHRLTIIMPCLDYARQDRRMVAGEAIPPKLLLRCMKTAGADRFLTVDLHNQAEAGFTPARSVLDELSADKYLADFVRANVANFNHERVLVCATNGGGMKFTRRMADHLRTGFMMADRFRPQAGGVGEIKLISDSHTDCVEAIIIVDDMFDTCGNLQEVCAALSRSYPQAKIYAIGTHGYLSGDAHLKIKKLVETAHFQWLAVTNSVTLTGALERLGDIGMRDRLKIIDISRLVAGAIIRIHLGASVNLPKFRGLGPATHDPVLHEAALVPAYQYTYVAGPEAPTRDVKLQRQGTQWE